MSTNEITTPRVSERGLIERSMLYVLWMIRGNMSLQQISMDRYGKDYDDLALIQRMYVIKDFLKIAKKEADIYCSLPKKPK